MRADEWKIIKSNISLGMYLKLKYYVQINKSLLLFFFLDKFWRHFMGMCFFFLMHFKILLTLSWSRYTNFETFQQNNFFLSLFYFFLQICKPSYIFFQGVKTVVWCTKLIIIT